MTTTRTEGEVRALLAEVEEGIKEAALNGDFDKATKLGQERSKLLKEVDAIEFEANRAERNAWLDMVKESLESVVIDNLESHLEVTYSGLDTDTRGSKVNVVFEGLNVVVAEALDGLLDQTPKGVKSFTYTDGEIKLGNAPVKRVGSANGVSGAKGWVVNGETISLGQAFEALAGPDEVRALEVIKENAEGLKSVGSKAYSYQVKVVSGHGATKA